MTNDKPPKKLVGISESGHRVGEDHQRARLTDAEVEHIRDLHEHKGMGYRAIAKKLNMPLSTVSMICAYHRRNTYAVGFKLVPGEKIGYQLKGKQTLHISFEDDDTL